MERPIQQFAFDCVLAIAFTNNTHTPPSTVVWVCESTEAFKQAVEKLEEMSHITILCKGASHIERVEE